MQLFEKNRELSQNAVYLPDNKEMDFMADNYLEKQYAEYEARKAAWEKARKLGKKKTNAVSSPTKTEQSPKTTSENDKK